MPVRPKIAPFSFGDDEFASGEHVQVSCIVSEGDLPVDISWTFHGLKETSMMGISTTKLGPRSSILQIEAVAAGHSGDYTCIAKNAAGSQNFTANLRVSGKKKNSRIRRLVLHFPPNSANSKQPPRRAYHSNYDESAV